MPFRLFLALVVIVLGIISSIITAIIAAIVLVAVVSVLRLDRKSEIRLVVLACFSIGMGAAAHTDWRTAFYDCYEQIK